MLRVSRVVVAKSIAAAAAVPGSPAAAKPSSAAEDFTMAAMTTHSRSQFSYEGSAKSEEVGARNEAAKMNYQSVKPPSVQLKYAMPSYLNLLTITPVFVEAFGIGAVTWGIFLWYLYGTKNYEPIMIQRGE